MISIIIDSKPVKVDVIKFSDGSTNIKVHARTIKRYASVTIDPDTPANDVLWEALQAHDALLRINPNEGRGLYLNLPYMPHARADRVFEVGNSFPLEIFCKAISVYERIFTVDPHSGVAQKYFREFQLVGTPQYITISQSSAMSRITKRTVIVAPDKGAVEKATKVMDYLPTDELLIADKVRDPLTGRITSTEIPDVDLTGKSCMIVDDIADGGGTFIPLAEKLLAAGAETVDLYVTHGIFSKGLEIFKGFISKIHTYHIVGSYVSERDIIKYNQKES